MFESLLTAEGSTVYVPMPRTYDIDPIFNFGIDENGEIADLSGKNVSFTKGTMQVIPNPLRPGELVFAAGNSASVIKPDVNASKVIGTGDFELEWYMSRNGTNQYHQLAIFRTSQRDGLFIRESHGSRPAGMQIYSYDSDNTLTLAEHRDPGTNNSVSYLSSAFDNRPLHYRITRINGILRMYVNNIPALHGGSTNGLAMTINMNNVYEIIIAYDQHFANAPKHFYTNMQLSRITRHH